MFVARPQVAQDPRVSDVLQKFGGWRDAGAYRGIESVDRRIEQSRVFSRVVLRQQDVSEDQQMRSALRELIEVVRPEVRFTAQQNLLLAGIAEELRAKVGSLLRAYGIVPAAGLPPVLRQSMACPALPTCGQAITESERVWPLVAGQIQQVWDAAGLYGEPLCVRMTGCPNGCARPYTAEIGIVGQSTDRHSIYLGGSPLGTRLAELFRHEVRLEELPALLRPLFEEYAAGRAIGERFGDWAARKGIARLKEIGRKGELILRRPA